MVEKVEFRPFVFLISNDEFHREVGLPGTRSQKGPPRKSGANAGLPRRRSPAERKVKLAPRAEARRLSAGCELEEERGLPDARVPI